MAEKTEKPTPGRQQKSAKKGQTFKSKDVIITCTLISCFIYMYFFFNFTSFVDFYKLVLINSGTVDSGIFFKTLFWRFYQDFHPIFRTLRRSNIAGYAITDPVCCCDRSNKAEF